MTWTCPRVAKTGMAIMVTLAVAMAVVLWRDHRRPDPVIAGPVQVNDSTTILAAQLASARHELDALKDAARKSKGKLVAGVRIEVRPETVWVDRIVRETTTESDGTRVVAVRDTTPEGVEVNIDASAPPAPAPMSVGYRVVLPAFTPEVGFMRKGQQYYAVVSLAGRNFTPSQSFFTVPRERRIHLIAGGEAMTNREAVSLIGYVGPTIRLTDHLTTGAFLTTGNQILVRSEYKIF